MTQRRWVYREWRSPGMLRARVRSNLLFMSRGHEVFQYAIKAIWPNSPGHAFLRRPVAFVVGINDRPADALAETNRGNLPDSD